MELGKWDAVVYMEAAVRLDSRHAPTLVRSGEMLLELGAIERATNRAEEAIALDPALAGAWALRVLAFFLRLAGNIGYYLGRLVVNVYDLVIFPALWLEALVARKMVAAPPKESTVNDQPIAEHPENAPEHVRGG